MSNRPLVALALAALLGLAAAQGPVTFYTAGPGGLAAALAEAFTAATGIPVEVYQATSGDVLARLEAERGNPRADVVVLASWGEGLDLAGRGFVADYASPERATLRDGWTSGERRATIAGVDCITYGNTARGEAPAIVYPTEGTAVALRPLFLQAGAPNVEGGRAFIDFMLSEAGQALVANVYLIPAREGVEARRPVPGDFVALPADDAEVAATVDAIVQRFRTEIVEGIVQQR